MDENCSVLDTKLDGWEEIVNGNLTASYNAARAFCAKLRKGSAIVMTGSCLVYFARPGYRLYAISKVGISASTRQLALELAPNVWANCVAPSAVDLHSGEGVRGVLMKIKIRVLTLLNTSKQCHSHAPQKRRMCQGQYFFYCHLSSKLVTCWSTLNKRFVRALQQRFLIKRGRHAQQYRETANWPSESDW